MKNRKKTHARSAALIAGIVGILLIAALIAVVFWANSPAGEAWFLKRFPPGVMKPVIYFYPQKTTAVRAEFADPSGITVSYPEYGTGWDFIASPGGKLICGGKQYPYLYYEMNAAVSFGERGFVVPKGETVTFLEEKLEYMGFDRDEATDFITYWLPRLEKNGYNRIEFVWGDELEALMPLKITPVPDNILRVYMIFSSCRGDLKLEPQQLPVLSRDGFAVLEWGGAELP